MSMKTRTTTRQMARLFTLGMGALSCSLLLACGEDSVLGDDEAFMSDDDGGPNTSGPLEPNDCDMTGTWMAQIRSVSLAMGSAEAISYNWFYYELDDTGDDVVIERGWDCGFVVCGDVTEIQLTNIQTETLSLHNRQDGVLKADPENIMEPASEEFLVDPRGMTFAKNDDGTCEFSMERWWWIRSADISFLPDRADYATATIGDLHAAKPLPENSDKIPAEDAQPEEDVHTPWDWDEDGKVGLNLQLDKPVVGWRDAIQRDWNEIPATQIPDGSEDFTVVAKFDNEEQVYDASNAMLKVGSEPASSGHTWRFVKVDSKAPEDLAGFTAYCETQRDKIFREQPLSANYCDMRPQFVNDESTDDD